MRRILSITIALLLTAAIAAPAGAQMRGMRGGMHGDEAFGCGMMCGGMMGGGMMGGMLCGMADRHDWGDVAEKLDLSDEQKERIMEHNHETVRNMMKSRNELQLRMFDLNTELRKTDPDQGTVDDLVDEISSMRREMLQQRIAAIGHMREILTEEQWMRFKHMKLKDRDDDDDMMMRRGRRMMR